MKFTNKLMVLIYILIHVLVLSLIPWFALAEPVADASRSVEAVKEITPEPTPEPVQPNPDRYIEVWADFREVLYEGESVWLYSRLVGFEEATSISYQWQKNNGSGWQDISGATSDSHCVIVSSESLNAEYRVMVTSVWGD